MKKNTLKAQTLFLMVDAMHRYIKRLGQPFDSSIDDNLLGNDLFKNDLIKQKLNSTENAFYQLTLAAENINSKSLKLNFKNAA